ncbi:MAG TPA: hypothetical protein VD993_01210 [Chitinophagaceae bacterium]|nr:hypothetical protein [Chitinophagaceae bacterium]
MYILTAIVGGGCFVFGFIDSYASVPAYVERISFLDSNYGYDSLHAPNCSCG